MNKQNVIDTLWFWDAFPDKRKKGEELVALEAGIRTSVEAMADDTRAKFVEIARRQYEAQDSTRTSVTSRASTLLLFVGVILTGATVVAASLKTSQPIILVGILIDGAALLYACLAVAFLAVRAQEVATWTGPAIYAKQAISCRALEATDAVEHAVAWEQNKPGLQHVVAYLLNAQQWARRAIILVVILAILSVAAAATKPPDPPAPGSVPAATATPEVTPLVTQAPTATPSTTLPTSAPSASAP